MRRYTRGLSHTTRAATVLVVRECPERKNEALWVALTGAAVFLVTFAHNPSAWKTIWAEDGTVFLAGVITKASVASSTSTLDI